MNANTHNEMLMTNIKTAVKNTVELEGGYDSVFAEADGSLSFAGLNEKTVRNMPGWKNISTETLRGLSIDHVNTLYYDIFWREKRWLRQIATDKKLTLHFHDALVQHGEGTAVVFLQETINDDPNVTGLIDVDGIYGSQTESAIQACIPHLEFLVRKFYVKRFKYYTKIATQTDENGGYPNMRFLAGWTNRMLTFIPGL